MAQQRGSQVPIIFEEESAFKELPAGTNAAKLYYVSESLRLNRNLVSSKTLRGTRNPVMPVRGNVDVTGDINFELSPNIGKLLRCIFGGTIRTTGGTGAYIHRFTIGDLPSFTVEKYFSDIDATDKYFQYVGCKVNNFKVTANTEGFIDSSISIMGADELQDSASMKAGVRDDGHTPFDGFGGSLWVNGSQVMTIVGVDFTLENTIDGNTYVMDGTGTRYSMPESIAKVTGTLRGLFTDADLYTDAINYTERKIELRFSRGTGAGTLGNEKLIFFLDEAVLKPQTPVVSGPTGLQVELPFEAYYDNSTDSDYGALHATLYSSLSTFA